MADELIAILSLLHPIQLILIILLILLVTNIPLITKLLADLIKKKNRKINHHLICPHYGDEYFFEAIEPMVNKVADKKIRIFEIQKYDILEDQMLAANKTIDNIKSMLLKSYHSFNPSDRDSRHYRLILNNSIYDTKQILREYAKKNHLLDYDTNNFKKYVDDTIDDIVSYWTNKFFELYMSTDFEISSDMLHEQVNMPNLTSIKEQLEYLMYKMRQISEKYDLKIKELEE